SGRINQRRKNKIEHNVWIQVHRRQARHETQSESAKNEHNRIRQRDFVRQHGQNPDGTEQKDDNLGLVHESLAPVAGALTQVPRKAYLIQPRSAPAATAFARARFASSSPRCFSDQRHSPCSGSINVRPSLVSEYSTLGGTTGCTVRCTRPSRSRLRKAWVSIF